MLRLLGNPLTSLVIFAAALSGSFCAYFFLNVVVSEPFLTAAGAGWNLMIILWADADARRRRQTPCFDFGFLAMLSYPVSVLWYCFWSRGWRGGLLFLLLLFLWIAPYILAAVFWIVQFGIEELVRLD
jgi:hypothetical protein